MVRAHGVLDSAVSGADLDGYIGILLLATAPQRSLRTQAWLKRIVDILRDQPPRQVAERGRPLDTAITGVRLHLQVADDIPTFVTRARRELSRPQSAVIPSLHDDPQLLIGVAAGVGAVAPELVEDVLHFSETWMSEHEPLSIAVGLWARSLVTARPIEKLDRLPAQDDNSTRRWFRHELCRLWLRCRARDGYSDAVVDSEGCTERCGSDVGAMLSVVAQAADWSTLDAAMVMELAYALGGESLDDARLDVDRLGQDDGSTRGVDARRCLLTLLGEIFSEDEFEMLLRGLDGGTKLLDSVPSRGLSKDMRFSELVAALERRQMVTDDFFAALRDVRPYCVAKIDGVATMFRCP